MPAADVSSCSSVFNSSVTYSTVSAIQLPHAGPGVKVENDTNNSVQVRN